MAREGAVQQCSLVIACGFVLLVFLAVEALGDITYQDDGPIAVDRTRNGNGTCSHEFYFNVQYRSATRLCRTKPIVTVNGMFPGPPIYVREGDTVIVHVKNSVDYNLTLHWHGLRQLLQNWQDGPAYFTQCPIQPGASFTYNFTISDQKRGTLWWHAHITWLRATLHGAFVILPRVGQAYPFIEPKAENILIFGEWWIGDTEAIEAEAIRTGAGYNFSDALTLNGQPGDLYNCSAPETTVVKVEAGGTYLLRLINAAMNFELYFGIANHTLEVVEADGEYTKLYRSTVVRLTPGQSMNVLLCADQRPGLYYIATSVWSPVPNTTIPFPQVPATAILEYAAVAPLSGSLVGMPAGGGRKHHHKGSHRRRRSGGRRHRGGGGGSGGGGGRDGGGGRSGGGGGSGGSGDGDGDGYGGGGGSGDGDSDSGDLLPLPVFPAYNDSQWAFDFDDAIRSVDSNAYPARVALTVDEPLFFTVGYNFLRCRPDQGCGQQNGTLRIALTINNNTFAVPRNRSILEAYYYSIQDVYDPDFPDNPPFVWDFTGPNPSNNTLTQNTTRVNVLKFGSNVQLVLQNTNILFFESHPFHLHGFSFYVVGSGFGNFDAARDTPNFNLRDPPLRNTVSVPAGGWTAIRWKASNPGVWLMHCHLDIHQSWGMSMAFIVLNGHGPDETLPPPPPNMPKC